VARCAVDDETTFTIKHQSDEIRIVAIAAFAGKATQIVFVPIATELIGAKLTTGFEPLIVKQRKGLRQNG
jgi:hypothetical protein